MAISPTQRQKAAQSRFASVKPESTTWFWVGYEPGREGQIGIVRDGDGLEQRGFIRGNTQPRLRAPVQFTPGQPIGNITVPSVSPVEGGSSGPTIPGESTIIYGIGDPFTNQVPWVPGAHYLDTALGRSYIAGPPLTGDFEGVDGFWLSTGPYSFDASSRVAADAFYAGDIYQAPDDAFFRLDNAGDWKIQWFCPDCEEEPDPPPGRVCSDAGYSADWPRPGLSRPSNYPRFFYNCI